MKLLILFSLALFVPGIFYGQSFEGEIVYKMAFKSKIPNVSDVQLTAMMGDTNLYYIQGGNYKTVSNGKYLQWQVYINAVNKLYNKTSNSESLVWMDAGVYNDSLVSVTLRPGAAQILGYTCDEITMTCKSSVQEYYYSSKIPEDSKIFEKHLFGSWYDFLSRAHALPLKMSYATKEFIMESTAVTVQPGHLDPAIFQIPSDAKLTSAPKNDD